VFVGAPRGAWLLNERNKYNNNNNNNNQKEKTQKKNARESVLPIKLQLNLIRL